MQENLHVRIAILSPGTDVTALKFRGWLRAEAKDIDQRSRESGMDHKASVIHLYLPARLRAQIGQAKLDRMLHDVVNKYETIYRIELRSVEEPLTLNEMMLAQDEARKSFVALEAFLGDPNETGGNNAVH